MSKRIYEFRCPLGHVTERYIDEAEASITCECGELAVKAICTPPRIDRLGIGAQKSASPESIAYFDKVHRQQKAHEEKQVAEHGSRGAAPGSD